MAFASVGTLGSVNSQTANQSTLVLTTSATLEANNLGVLIVSVDNNQTTDGDEGAVSGVVDSAGNTWTKGAEFTNGQGAAQSGATCSIWYKRVSSQLTSGGTITISFTNNTSRDASAATAWEFTVGNTVSLEGTPGTLANDNADAGSLDVTTSNIECLRIRGVAAESGTITVSSNTASWTAFTRDGGNSGGDATGSTVIGEFIISTGTGSASDPTLSLNRDLASVYIALKEVTTNKTLTADGGSYALTGTDVTIRKGHPLAAGAGSYALTGTAASVLHAWRLTAGAVSYALTGTTANVLHGWKLAAGAGSYVLTGADVTLQINIPVIAAAGSYTLTGTSASLLRTWLVTAEVGSYTLTGQSASVLLARKLVAGSEIYLMTGTDADILYKLGSVRRALYRSGAHTFWKGVS